MLTDYERYQLEWMIEHGHSLKEFVQGLDLVDRDGIDSLEEAYAIWENDYGFGGEVFSNEREFKEEDLPAMNVGAHGETLRQMVADTTEMPAKAVELIKSLYVVEGAMAQDHGIDYLFDNIEILTASVRDMLNREGPSAVSGRVNTRASSTNARRCAAMRIGIAGTPTPSWMASQGTSSVRRMPHSRSPASRASWRCTTPRTTIPRPVTSS